MHRKFVCAPIKTHRLGRQEIILLTYGNGCVWFMKFVSFPCVLSTLVHLFSLFGPQSQRINPAAFRACVGNGLVVVFCVACVRLLAHSLSFSHSLNGRWHVNAGNKKKKKSQSFTKSVCRFQRYIYRSANVSAMRVRQHARYFFLLFRSFQDVFFNSIQSDRECMPRMRAEIENADELR